MPEAGANQNAEQIARDQIDRQLGAAGWIVQDKSKINLAAATGVAVREVASQGGPADYILFAEGRAIGVVEAKKAGTTLSAVADQSSRYSYAMEFLPERWADPLPFTYESTGVETQFVDQRDPDARSRTVFSFHRPEQLLEWVHQPNTLRERLRQIPVLSTAPLRDCQVSAIQGLESSLAQNKPRALIQMATGSGKTFMAVTTAYRLIKHAGAKRILFLVDRGNLGRQTVNEFQQFDTPDDGRKFTNLYNVQMLGPGGIDPVCQVTVSTIQRLYSQLMGQELDEEADEHSLNEIAGGDEEEREVRYNPAIPVESFDFIIIDECHRSIYNLWKQVLDYFDAFLIGLTATPSKATLGFFDQNLVTEYPHVQAVADGVNVGYDIYRIKTAITEQGGKLECGFDYQRRDRLTRSKRWALQDEDEAYDASRLDRSVVAVNQIRKVLEVFKEKLFAELFTDRPVRAAALGLDAPWVPKTLIFAKDDSHAEDIVKITREVFGKGNDFCKKVTYKAGANPEQMIKAFRTDPAFRIAVTVDMIATGTDIKPLECLLFMRDVRSQLYFEQMKGRGTRTIDPTDLAGVTPDAGTKSRFILVDAVGVTETDKTDSRPLERKPTVSFEKLMLQIAMGKRDEATLSSMANRLARLDRKITSEARAELEAAGGVSIKQLAAKLLKATDPDEIERVAEASRLSSSLFKFYDERTDVEKAQGAYLPHWHQDGVIYFVTFRLADSLPQEKLKALAVEKEQWLKLNPLPHSAEQEAEYHERFSERVEQWLDAGYGSMILKDQEANQLVLNALKHFDGERYTLDEFVVAANHVHVLVAPRGEHTLSDILHSWKSYTAKEILKLPVAFKLSTAPTVWQKESWDHIVRSPASLEKFREYIRGHQSVAEASRLRKTEAELRRDAAATLAQQAVAPIATQPAFRELLEKTRRDTEIVIDHITQDTLISADYDYERAEQLITSWKTFLDEHQDEITALQILYNKPHAKRHLTYDEIKQLADTVSKPPYHLAPDEVWKAYEHLEKRPRTANPVKTLTNLITLVRHTINPEQSPLHPFPELVEARYQQWLAQQQGVAEASRLSSSDKDQRQDASAMVAEASRLSGSEVQRQDASATPRFTEKQLHWLGIIKNYIALNGAFNTDDPAAYLEAWQSVDSEESVPFAVAKRAFGQDPKPIIEELNEVLVA